MEDNLDLIQTHLNRLTELTNQINDTQNILRNKERTLSEQYEHDKKMLLDLHLKYATKIAEAKKYYTVVTDIDKLNDTTQHLEERLEHQKTQLHKLLTDTLPDELFTNADQIRKLRQSLNETKLELKINKVKVTDNVQLRDKLAKKYSDSICRTSSYFQLKQDSIASVTELNEAIGVEKHRMNRLRGEYRLQMSKLEALSQEIHTEKANADMQNNSSNDAVTTQLLDDDDNGYNHTGLDGMLNDPIKYRQMLDEDFANIATVESTQNKEIAPTYINNNNNKGSGGCRVVSHCSINELNHSHSPHKASFNRSLGLPGSSACSSHSAGVIWHPLI